MDYNKYKIDQLKEIVKERNIQIDGNVNKKYLVNTLEKFDKAQKALEADNVEEVEVDVEFEPEILTMEEFSNAEVKELNEIANNLSVLGRKNRNEISDTDLKIEISKTFDDYETKHLARIERLLLAKNVKIKYSDMELKEAIEFLNDRNLGITEEEINLTAESLLSGITKQQDSDEVKNFLSSINDYPLLSKDKELELGKILDEYHALAEEDKAIPRELEIRYLEARELLSLSNKRLVVSIAKKYINRGMDIIDLVMEGMLGLERAIGKYDYTTGYKFSTYATWWIRQGITRALADKSKAIRIPVHMVETINKVTKAQRELTQELGQEPTFQQIGEAVVPPMSVEEIEYIFNIAKDPILLEMPIGDDNSSLESFIEDDKHSNQNEESEKNELRRKLLELIERLPDRESEVLMYRYGLYNLDEKPYELKIQFLKEIKKMITSNTITCIQLEDIIETTDQIPEHQRQKYLGRIKQNNEKYERKINEIAKLADKEDVKSVEKREKLEAAVEEIRESNIKYIEQSIEISKEQLEILIKVQQLTENIVKPLTLEEVGMLFEVTRERIRQIETKGKRKLKAFAQKEQLGLYLNA